MEDAEAREFEPHVVFVDSENHVIGTGNDPAEALPGSGLTARRRHPEPVRTELSHVPPGARHQQQPHDAGHLQGRGADGALAVASDEPRTSDEWYLVLQGLVTRTTLAEVTAVSVCCTVPSILVEIRDMIDRYYAKAPVSIVGPGVKTGVPIHTDNPRRSAPTASSTPSRWPSCTAGRRSSST